MKALVFSDSHGKIKLMKDIIEMEKPDIIIHLGDNTYDVSDLANDIEVLSVRGNCDVHDFETPLELTKIINGKKIFMTHGHMYGVKMSQNNIYYRGLELDVDIILFGHTHIPVNDEEDGIKILNPGSIERPRFTKRSYAIINFSKEIETEIKYVE